MTVARPTRRELLALAATLPFLPGSAQASQTNIAVVDWGLLETALAIGAVPTAATELLQFRRIVVEPAVPETVSDLGLRGSPSFELLRVIKPELILISGFYEYQRPSLERIAPVLGLPVYEAGKPPYPLAEHSTLALGERLGRSAEAKTLLQRTDDELARARSRLGSLAERPVFVISLGDSRHFRAFGADTMFGDVLVRLGLANAWQEATSYSAAAPVGIEALARVPDAFIVTIGPLPPEVRRGLGENALWNALPSVREGRTLFLDPINHFGALPTAQRFARLLTAGIESLPHG